MAISIVDGRYRTLLMDAPYSILSVVAQIYPHNLLIWSTVWGNRSVIKATKPTTKCTGLL